jgi:ATP-dependent Clp protease ATP-binding subunit ClpC
MKLGDLFGHDIQNTITQTVQAPQPNGQAVNGLAGGSVDPLQKQDISVLSKLDSRAVNVLQTALEEAKRVKSSFIEPEQLLIGLLSDRDVFNLLQNFSLDIAKVVREIQGKEVMGQFSGEPVLSENTKQILENAGSGAKTRNSDFISPEDILLALFTTSVAAADQLKAQGLEKEKIAAKLSEGVKGAEFATGKKSVLAQFGVDLTQKAKDGKLDPITGRDTEVERMVHILLRRTKNNPIIIGEAGVGKTAIVEGLAQLMVSGKVTPDLSSKKIIQLDVSSLIAGASHRGEFEERLQNVIKETIAATGQIILFIDEIHTIIGAGDSGGSLDASNILKPYLSRGQLQIIGTTTTAEYRRNFEKDRAFERRFQPILCDEPSEEVAEAMIKVLQAKYEQFHKVTFSPESIKAAVKLSKRYIGERFLPDKAIDLMDEAAAEVRLSATSGKRPDSVVKENDIQNVVSRWTGIPISKLTEEEGQKLLHLEELIHKKFINHERAVKAVAEAVRRGRIGLSNASRPIASFIFLGPTGTGKTELAKRLAEIMFGREDAMIRLDMSEYMEKHEVAKLVGAPPGYVGYEEGGQLTEAVRTKPYSIVLLDEVEKAHPDVFNILLQLLEDGRLTDNKGNTISFKNTVIICTSNIGSDLIRQKLQENATSNPVVTAPPTVTPVPPVVQSSPVAQTPGGTIATPTGGDAKSQQMFKELSKTLMDQLLKFFRPELVNRFDEVVIFEPLTQSDMLNIANLGIENTRKLLKDQNVGIQISQNALGQLAKEGFDPVYGARPLRRLIQRVVENPIAIYLIQKAVVAGDIVIIDYDSTNDRFVFSKSQNSPSEDVKSQDSNVKTTT